MSKPKKTRINLKARNERRLKQIQAAFKKYKLENQIRLKKEADARRYQRKLYTKKYYSEKHDQMFNFYKQLGGGLKYEGLNKDMNTTKPRYSKHDQDLFYLASRNNKFNKKSKDIGYITENLERIRNLPLNVSNSIKKSASSSYRLGDIHLNTDQRTNILDILNNYTPTQIKKLLDQIDSYQKAGKFNGTIYAIHNDKNGNPKLANAASLPVYGYKEKSNEYFRDSLLEIQYRDGIIDTSSGEVKEYNNLFTFNFNETELLRLFKFDKSINFNVDPTQFIYNWTKGKINLPGYQDLVHGDYIAMSNYTRFINLYNTFKDKLWQR